MEETLDRLKQGLVDGAETWSSAVAFANMSHVVSQIINPRLVTNFEVFESLEPHLREAVIESAYFTQALIEGAHEAALVNTVGHSVPQLPGTFFDENGTRFVLLSDEEREKAAQMSAPELFQNHGSSGACGSTVGPGVSTL